MNELAVHPKGDYLAAADDSGMVKVYNTRTRRVEKTLNAHTVRRRCRHPHPHRRCRCCCLVLVLEVVGALVVLLVLLLMLALVVALVGGSRTNTVIDNWPHFPFTSFRTASRPCKEQL